MPGSKFSRASKKYRGADPLSIGPWSNLDHRCLRLQIPSRNRLWEPTESIGLEEPIELSIVIAVGLRGDAKEFTSPLLRSNFRFTVRHRRTTLRQHPSGIRRGDGFAPKPALPAIDTGSAKKKGFLPGFHSFSHRAQPERSCQCDDAAQHSRCGLIRENRVDQ